MNRFLLASAVAAACACTASPPLEQETVFPEQNTGDAAAKENVERSVRERFGEAVYRRALAAHASLMIKNYDGFPGPTPEASSSPRVALLFRESGRWLKADSAGVRLVEAKIAANLAAVLSAPAFWGEPRRVPVTCTDAGANLMVLRYPSRGTVVRQGTCGAPPLTMQIVSFALTG